MYKGAGNKSVDFSTTKGTAKANETANKDTKVMERSPFEAEVALGGERLNEIVRGINRGRLQIAQRIVEKSPDDDKSNKSKRKRKQSRVQGASMSQGRKSINDSQIDMSAGGISGIEQNTMLN